MKWKIHFIRYTNNVRVYNVGTINDNLKIPEEFLYQKKKLVLGTITKKKLGGEKGKNHGKLIKYKNFESITDICNFRNAKSKRVNWKEKNSLKYITY